MNVTGDTPKNLALLLTPPGAAAIAVVRLSGPRTPAFLDSYFSRRPAVGRCVHGELRDEAGEVIDDPVVVLEADGGAADLNLHGGAWVVASVLELARRGGFDVLEPSLPVPAEALDVAAGDVLEAEMLSYVPLARTEQALRLLLAQPAAWARWLGDGPSPADLERVADDESLWWLLHPPRVAIAGAPNVGKSTLANQLFAQERSITADLSGTTRDWVGEIANLDGLAVMLVDTPGVRTTTDPIEREAIERSGRVVAGADAVILVLDASRPVEAAERELRERFADAIVVLNKSDRAVTSTSSERDAIQTVATTGTGVDDLRRVICRRFGCVDLSDPRPRWWTPRQRHILRDAVGDCAGLAQLL